MALTDVEIRTAKAVDKPLKMFDGGGLFLLVNPNGSRWWRFKHRYEGKERGLCLGVYPDVSLKRARAGRDEARRMLIDGVDPSASRQADKQARAVTFQAIADEWLEQQAKKVAPITLSKARWMITEFIVLHIGARPIHKITPADVLAALRHIEARGKHETAHRTKQCVGQILRYAVATSRAERDVTADLRGALGKEPRGRNRCRWHRRATESYRRLPWSRRAQARASGIRATGRTAPSGMVRDQLRGCGMADPGAQNEDARGAHRSTLKPSAENSSRAATPDGVRTVCVSVYPKQSAAHVGEHD